ncbi:MAG TPA: flagellar biosynthetic protein FliR [Polyangiaceae bacterium]|jgi:flagellar biosynthetic protein FliR|nr:flagellar biosynthetic protein FliR [Polyangiaceae bacterium]
MLENAMNELFTLVAGELGVLALAITRLTGLVITAPFGWELAPLRVRGAFVVVTALAVHGLHPKMLHSETLSPFDWGLLLVVEFLLGAAMGFVVRVTVSIAEMAGEAFSSAVGLGAAQMFDPQNGAPSTVMTRIFRTLTILLALGVGAHRVVLGAVIESFRAAPVGGFYNPGASAEHLLSLVGTAIASGARISIPVIALLFMTQVALAFISRAAPAMQIFSVGFAVTLGIGALALVLTLPDTAHEMLVQLSYLGRHVESVAQASLGALP